MSVSALFLASAAAMVVGGLSAFRAPRVWLAACLIAMAGSFTAAVVVLSGGTIWNWTTSLAVGGERLHLCLDGLSAFFLALISLLGAAGSVYARGYWPDREHPASAPAARAWWTVLLVSMGLVLICANGVHFLIGWELFGISTYFLITCERRHREVRAAGWLQLAASHASTVFLFAFFAGLAARTGSWDLSPLRQRADLAPLFWLALVGFGLKAGLFPLHIWLPSAHANSPSHVSSILSGAALKVGVYGLMRFSGWLVVPDAAGWSIAALGVASAVLGVAFALAQHDLKRLLAYHSVENIGIICIGLGFAMVSSARGHVTWGRLALAGALLHVWNHGLFKSLLFLAAGSVVHVTRTRQMSRLGGLWRTMPWTTGLFVLGAVAIVGLPPLNGFVSEYLVLLGLFDAVSTGGSVAWSAVPAAVMLAVTGALALACFAKVCGVVFLGNARTSAARSAHESGWLLRAPMLVLGAACVAIGVAPAAFWPAVARACVGWRSDWIVAEPPAPLLALETMNIALAITAALAALALWRRSMSTGLRRAVTWDCGYAAPTPRMQYSAGSFAGILTGWFSWILRPRRQADLPQGLFPTHARVDVHTPETVLEHVVEPSAAAVMRISAAVRRLQHGRIQAYILYLLLGVAALAALALTGGGK